MSGLRFLVGRIMQGLVVLWIVTSASFLLIHLAPGGPSILADPKLAPAEREAIEHRLGLDRPIAAQYVAWHRNLLRGDLGRSYLYETPAFPTVLARLPNTLLLAGLALLVSLALAIPLGVRSGLRPGGAADRLLSGFSFVAISVPPFWLGIVLILCFAALWHLLPAGGMSSSTGSSSPGETLRHLILPVTALALPGAAEFLRFVRAGTATAATAPHVPAATARGVPQRKVVRRHVLRDALLPLLTVIGLQAPMLVGGAAITETVFSWPGLGRLGVEAALSRDYPVVMALTVAVAGTVVLINVLLDLAYHWADPRFRVS